VTAVLLDTHAWAWSLTADPRLSPTATDAIQQAEAVFVSPISFFEIGQKVRVGKWPEMAEHVAALPSILQRQGGLVAALSPEICVRAATMDWAHRDPFDRLIAATAMETSWPLISADTAFDGLDRAEMKRVW
jgi:PIN domain nuclease of toxin-antitoxin system